MSGGSPAGAALELLTSAEAADRLGVSPSTVKRWVDEGELEAERTVGGHRRITVAALDAFRARLSATATTIGPADQLVDLLLGDTSPQRIEARLLALRAETGSAVALAAEVADALRVLGDRWARGVLTVVDEHLASERLARALALEERVVGGACADIGATLLVGGAGAWPARPRHAQLVRDLGEADRLVRALAAQLTSGSQSSGSRW